MEMNYLGGYVRNSRIGEVRSFASSQPVLFLVGGLSSGLVSLLLLLLLLLTTVAFVRLSRGGAAALECCCNFL